MTDNRFPKRIGTLIGQLLSRRGYAQVIAIQSLQIIVESEVGESLAKSIQVGNLRGGTLHIYAGDSVTLQELTFRKRALLKRLQTEMPENRIIDLRFRVQTI